MGKTFSACQSVNVRSVVSLHGTSAPPKASGMTEPYYQDDWATIWLGDCREILPTLPPADLVLTDPPYAISVDGSFHEGQPGRGTRNLDFFPGDSDWVSSRGRLITALRLALDRCSGSFYVWCGHRQVGDIVDMFEGCGFSTRPWVWVKACPAPAPPGSGWASAVELCIYAYPPGRTWELPVGLFPNVVTADGFRHGNSAKLGHPTQKPIKVIAPQIEASSRVNDTVLDPFMGSGTTLVAAKNLGRKSIGIEIEEKYAEIAAQRLSQEVLAL